MVGVFGHQHLGNERLAGQATVDEMCRCRRLHGGRLAFPATIAWAAGDEDVEGCGHHVEPLGDVLADDVQSTTAAAAWLVLDVMTCSTRCR